MSEGAYPTMLIGLTLWAKGAIAAGLSRTPPHGNSSPARDGNAVHILDDAKDGLMPRAADGTAPGSYGAVTGRPQR